MSLGAAPRGPSAGSSSRVTGGVSWTWPWRFLAVHDIILEGAGDAGGVLAMGVLECGGGGVAVGDWAAEEGEGTAAGEAEGGSDCFWLIVHHCAEGGGEVGAVGGEDCGVDCWGVWGGQVISAMEEG